MPKIDLSKVSGIIREVAVEQIMPRFRKLASGDVEMKGVNDPVTVADKESERHLTEQLTKYLPNSLVVGEESFAKDKGVMDHLDKEHPVWIIDPIDGTRNFVAGEPEFAVMIALVQNRKPIASWIHDPNSGDTIMAEKGAGVWLRGKKMKLAARELSADTVGLVGARVKKLISDPTVMPQTSDMPKIEIGSCAGFDYPRLFKAEDGTSLTFADSLSSRASFLLYRHTNAWDHVPGNFLHQEGGGYSANWENKPYNMSEPMNGLLYAPDKSAWLRLSRLFEPLMAHAAQKAP
ncbi:MAG TPA: inositol monophosphatase family protein [Alphaproteobacteria bacterium]|nr:inositol monophosphatase family protein [Alphaproteobacteria bacterium]